LLYSADGDFVVTLHTKATVYHTGKIVWEPPVIYKTYCPIDVEYFPFDMQECFMKFGSWTYDGHEVDLQHLCDSQAVFYEATKQKVIDRGIDLKDFYQNVEWDIINVTARRKEKFYPCCPEPYPDITFNITIRRRTLFYSLNLIMPCLSISGLTVLVFYLPSDSGEKITLSISILLALTVFFLLLSDINPPTSFVIPLIGKYLLFTMIVVTMSIFLAVYTLGIHFRKPSTHRMNPWVKRVFTEILPRILLMKRPDLKRKPKVSVRKPNGIELREMESIQDSTESWLNAPDNLRHRNNSGDSDVMKRYPPEVREALSGVKFVADHLRSTDEDNRASITKLLIGYWGGGQTTQLELDDFNFSINFSYLCRNIPFSPAYGVYISQLILYARSCSTYDQFSIRGSSLIKRGDVTWVFAVCFPNVLWSLQQSSLPIQLSF
jgi:nicotinic acetylcholine receptor